MDLTIALITILLSAFFSGIEIAFVSSNKLQLELDKGNENISSKIISLFSRNESNFITTMLIGNNISLVVYGIAMTKLLTPIFQDYFFDTYILLLVQTIVSTLIILVTAEFLTKSIFKIYLTSLNACNTISGPELCAFSDSTLRQPFAPGRPENKPSMCFVILLTLTPSLY